MSHDLSRVSRGRISSPRSLPSESQDNFNFEKFRLLIPSYLPLVTWLRVPGVARDRLVSSGGTELARDPRATRWPEQGALQEQEPRAYASGMAQAIQRKSST